MKSIESQEDRVVIPPPALYEAVLPGLEVVPLDYVRSVIDILPNTGTIPIVRPVPIELHPRSFDEIVEYHEMFRMLSVTIKRSPEVDEMYKEHIKNNPGISGNPQLTKILQNRQLILMPDRFPITVPGTFHSQLWIPDDNILQTDIGEFLARCLYYLRLDPKKDVVTQEKKLRDRTIKEIRHIHVLHRWPAI